MFHFKERDCYEKAHLICIVLILFAWVLFIVWRISYVQNTQKEIKKYEVIDAEHFDRDTNVEHLFLYGNFSVEKPVVYNHKDYAMIRHITVQYDWNEDPHTFPTKNGILYEKDILENCNYNSFYDTEYGENITFGNLNISEEELGMFKPYVVDSSWDDINHQQKFVSVLNTEQNYIVYIDSIEYGSMNGISIYQNMAEAREDLTPSLWGAIFLSFLVALVIYLICIFIIGMCAI